MVSNRESLISALEPFQDDETAFVHLTNILKVGIRPKTKWTDPLGVYTYPVKEMFERFESKTIPYGGSFKYAFIVRSNGRMLDLGDYGETHADFMKLAKKYHSDFTKPVVRGTNDALADPELYWDAISESWLRRYPYGGESLWELTQKMADFLALRTASSAAVIWRRLFVDLGYDGVVDRGDGIISLNEDCQAVLLTNKFDVVKAVINDTNRVPLRGQRDDY